MRTATFAALLSVSLAALPVAREARADPPPAAGKTDDASARFKAGVQFYKDKDFAAALVEFKRAYELSPNYNVLFNLGQTARELKDHAAALLAFEQYLHDGGAKISPARRKEVTAAIDDLQKKVGKLKIAVSVDGAEIAIDDKPVGVSPLAEPVVVNAGERKVTATASGLPPAQRVVDVPSQEQTSVTLDLVKVEAPPPPPPPEKKGPPLVAWVALGTTAGFAVATAVTGGLAVSARSSLKDALGMFPGNPQTISSAQSKTRTFAITTDVLGGVTIAGAVATTLVFVVLPRFTDKATVGFSPSGIVVRGAF